jgi:hypothetical protein
VGLYALSTGVALLGFSLRVRAWSFEHFPPPEAQAA